ncbi:MAG: biotin/lipoate A/B protein ligase family protein [Dehalococcoidia bacterium]
MTWRFLDSGGAPGARQMAVDEALLEMVALGRSPPVLRLFAFDPVCLSLGRFQAYSDGSHGVDTVRRPSGGRAVLHASDLCYTVVAPLDDPSVGGRSRDSYCRIALALTHALALLGARDVRFGPDREGHGRSKRPDLSGRACFADIGPYELTVGGVKTVGSAQVRRGGAFLQQGSLRLAADLGLEARLLERSQPALSDILGRAVGYAEAARTLRRAFAEALALTLEDSSLTAEEEALARALEAIRYANPDWTRQR